jgi:PAS domain S-box-containing protein
MSHCIHENTLKKSTFGYAWHEMLFDDTGLPADYIFLEANPAFGTMTGLVPDEIIGKKISEVLPEILADPFNWISFYGAMVQKGANEEFEQYSHALGRWFSVQAFATDPNHFATVCIDITDQKERTDELERFFSVNLDLLCIADMSGHFIKLNRAWLDILGHAPETLQGARFLDYVHPDDIAATLDAIATLVAHKNLYNFVNRCRCAAGSYRSLEWRSHPYGNFIYAAARDITEELQYRKKLEAANDRFLLAIEAAMTASGIGTSNTIPVSVCPLEGTAGL